MARWLNHAALRAMGLAGLAALAAVCAYAAGLAILRPLAPTEPPVHNGRVFGLLADLRDPGPPRFQPEALVAHPVFVVSRMALQQSVPVPEAPIFAVSTQVAASAPVDITPPDYILAGVMISDPERKVLLRKHKGEKGLWITRGKATSDGWIVLTVEPEKVTLSRSQNEFKLLLRSSSQDR